jgi:hypothetical protein
VLERRVVQVHKLVGGFCANTLGGVGVRAGKHQRADQPTLDAVQQRGIQHVHVRRALPGAGTHQEGLLLVDQLEADASRDRPAQPLSLAERKHFSPPVDQEGCGQGDRQRQPQRPQVEAP